MAQALARSRYVRFIERPDCRIAYHTLFGNLCRLDEDGYRFLMAFSEPHPLDDGAAISPCYSTAQIRSFANELIMRYLLLPAGTDELSIVEENERQRFTRLQSGYLIRALQLITTNACNYRCQYCFANLQRNELHCTPVRGGAVPMDNTIADMALESIILLGRRNGHRQIQVEFFGGEPLINWPVIHHVLTNCATGAESDPRIDFSITTNGSLITRSMAEVFRAHDVTVTISVDLPPQSRTPVLERLKTGDRLHEALRVLNQCGNRITFNSLVSPDTLPYFDEQRLVEFASKSGVREIGLILDLDVESYNNAETSHRVVQVLLNVLEYGTQVGITVVGYWYQIFRQISGAQAICQQSGYKTCPATGCKLSVEPDGSVFTCKCTSTRLGHIGDMDSLLASEAYRKYAMSAYRHAPQCTGCDIEGFCSGICMGSLENEYGRKNLVIPEACEIYRDVTNRLIERLPSNEIPLLSPSRSVRC